MVAVDLVSFLTSTVCHEAALVLVDLHSKWLSAVALKDKTSHAVVDALNRFILPSLLALPSRLLSDNGPEFRSAVFEETLESWGIKHVLTTPHKASSNGGAERAIKTLSGLLRGLCSQGGNWDLKLPQAVSVYNLTVHREINASPSQYLLQMSHDMS
jgi:transposase InsO family protein